MKVTVTRDVFTYDELEPAAQDVALEKLREAAYECLDIDMIDEEVNGRFVEIATGTYDGVQSRKEIADRFGVRFEWRVGGGQGDGAAIGGALRKESAPNLAWPDGVEGVITKISNYGWTQIDCIIVHDEAGDEYHKHNVDFRTMEAVNDMLETVCHKLYRAADAAIDNYCSAEYVLDAYRNHYGLQRRFSADGREAPGQFWTDDNTEVGQ
jgi:hypothetical protein